MLLIFPPLAKPAEPPAGIAKLAGVLARHHISCTPVDMNLEGLLFLLKGSVSGSDTWTKRAAGNREKNIALTRDWSSYLAPGRYGRAVNDLGRVLEMSVRETGVTAGLADYRDPRLSPVRSSDLLSAAEEPRRNVFYPYFESRLPELMEKQGASAIGISLNYLSQALTAFSMIGFVRKVFPRARIIAGGGLVTSWMRRPGWKNPFGGLVDDFVAGPGESELLRLLGVREVPPGGSAPAYECLPRGDYLSPGFILPYSASTGCYWNRCSFCPEPAEGSPYRPLAADRALMELRALVAAHAPVLVHLLDNAISPALLRALAEDPIGAPWYGFARLGPELEDAAFCEQLRRSGCVMLKLGLESGDQGVLDRMRKGIDLRAASTVLQNLERAGIGTYVYLLFGTPEETVAEARRTLSFIEKHRSAVSFLNLALFNMPVCSREAEEYGVAQFYEGDLSLYTDFRHPRGWDRKKVRRFLDTEFRRNPAVAAILRNDPPVFTSNHAAFFTPGYRSLRFKSSP